MAIGHLLNFHLILSFEASPESVCTLWCEQPKQAGRDQ